MNNIEIIGKKLATIRQFRKHTQEELAKKCGISRVYLGQIESGKRNPSLMIINKLCEILNIELTIELKPKELKQIRDD